MPQYIIQHHCELQTSQKDAIAIAITKLHCQTFNAPSIFVNVHFHPSRPHYIAGKLQETNSITGMLRTRGPEYRDKMNTLVLDLTEIWNKVVRPNFANDNVDGNVPGRLDDPTALHLCGISEGIVAAAEQGFLLPSAGQDDKWLEKNLKAFEKRAADGDEAMKALLEEIKTKGLGSAS
jgi:phenylpyruvate tautomerase PptA (4-oxalocrotonate tautomerase family)